MTVIPTRAKEEMPPKVTPNIHKPPTQNSSRQCPRFTERSLDSTVKAQHSVVVCENQSGEGPIYTCALAKDALVMQPFEGIDTVYDVVSYAARTHGKRNAVGWRDIVKIIEEEKEIKKVRAYYFHYPGILIPDSTSLFTSFPLTTPPMALREYSKHDRPVAQNRMFTYILCECKCVNASLCIVRRPVI